jgi:ABC-type branched-subunit amino acid transport system substrate-binding protein
METVKKVTVAYRDDAYGAGLADAFQKAFTNGTTTLIKFAVDADLKPVAAQVAATAPEALMFVDIGGERAVKFITSMSQTPAIAGLSLYLADGSKNEALLDDNLGDAIKNIIFNQTVGTVAAAPAGSDFNLFQSSYKSEFNGADPANSAFTANGYDALYVGAAGVVFASQNGNNYDGRQVAEGLSRLIMGKPTSVGKLGWGSIKSGLTTEPKTINIVGVSGALDFNPTVGEAAAPIEIWQPTKIAANCTNNKPPCFKRLTVISP